MLQLPSNATPLHPLASYCGGTRGIGQRSCPGACALPLDVVVGPLVDSVVVVGLLVDSSVVVVQAGVAGGGTASMSAGDVMLAGGASLDGDAADDGAPEVAVVAAVLGQVGLDDGPDVNCPPAVLVDAAVVTVVLVELVVYAALVDVDASMPPELSADKFETIEIIAVAEASAASEAGRGGKFPLAAASLPQHVTAMTSVAQAKARLVKMNTMEIMRQRLHCAFCFSQFARKSATRFCEPLHCTLSSPVCWRSISRSWPT
mmetsp:Transcript_17770/g.52997  ORF Transcript_17770/g.52997 Transcript_17770/m.52997 type:complete len:260 (-) Transcript_17770:341-1120(-)